MLVHRGVEIEADPSLLEKTYDNEEENIMMNVLRDDYKKDTQYWTKMSKKIK